MRFVDLFAGTGGFHYALKSLGHECVFASELNDELRELYAANFPEMKERVHGDIRHSKKEVPAHEILCAGFPCQPFSKSGAQQGLKDETRGTLFHEITEILEAHHPRFVILENVGNFARHDGGRTWSIVQEKLKSLGYNVRGTDHIESGGHGLISPHHFGFPHHRERFFIVASLEGLPADPFPRGDKNCSTSLTDIVLPATDLSEIDRYETRITQQQIECVDHWNEFLRLIPEDAELPSFPIWGDEFTATYTYLEQTPFWEITEGRELDQFQEEAVIRQLSTLPNYARTQTQQFPSWKIRFIKQNRDWYRNEVERHLTATWLKKLNAFPPSLRKLEWNCKGGSRNLWQYVLQFRPSGLRTKRYSSSPALVSMTTTQIPLLGPERRFLTRREGLRLQGLPDTHQLPRSRAKAFAALGNGVHVNVVAAIAERLLSNIEETVAAPSELCQPQQELAA
jgi:DNA (cytosine-5)-methyltransferase 1